MKKPNEKELEQFIHATLRSLPNRRAPGTLEARVLAEIERRAAVAWYHRSWAFWPAPIRALFLAVASGFSGAAIIAFYLFCQGIDTSAVAREIGGRFAGLSQLYAAAEWTINFAGSLIGSIPALWFYGGLAVCAVLYATFFGLGAAVYRTLYRKI